MIDINENIVELSEKKKKLFVEYENLPDGRLYIRKNSYYNITGKTEKTISNDHKKISSLVRKKILKVMIKNIDQNLILLRKIDKHWGAISEHEIISQLTSPYDKIPYNYYFHPNVVIFLSQIHGNPSFEEKNYKTLGGLAVRSKSEAVIGSIFEELKVPFQYERPFKSSSKIMYPDFTLIHPYTGEILIWEHFGLTDDNSYRSKMIEKLEFYEKAGFMVNKNLVTTYEFHLKNPSKIRSFVANFLRNGKLKI